MSVSKENSHKLTIDLHRNLRQNLGSNRNSRLNQQRASSKEHEKLNSLSQIHDKKSSKLNSRRRIMLVNEYIDKKTQTNKSCRNSFLGSHSKDNKTQDLIEVNFHNPLDNSMVKKFSKRELEINKPYKLQSNVKTNASLKFSAQNGWSSIEAFGQVLDTIRRKHDNKKKLKKIESIRSTLDQQMKEQRERRQKLVQEKQTQAQEMLDLTQKQQKEKKALKQTRRNRMNKERQQIDEQITRESQNRFILHQEKINAEKDLIEKVKNDIADEQSHKLKSKLAKQKEFKRLLEEKEVAKIKAAEDKIKEQKHDTQCLKQQELLLILQEQKRTAEKQIRESRIKARMDNMKETGKLKLLTLVIDKQESQLKQEEQKLYKEIQTKQKNDLIIESQNKQSNSYPI